MNRDQLAAAMADKFDVPSKRQAVDMVNFVFDSIRDALKRGEKVSIPGFGTFKVRQRKAREALNPRTGEKVHVPATTVPKFTAGKELKEAVK